MRVRIDQKPHFLARPDRVVGMPVARATFALNEEIPIARFQLNPRMVAPRYDHSTTARD
jgi:hypothetical protein